MRSRQENAIICEAQDLVNKGFKEIVLTGIHVCSYGADRNLESDALIDLVEKIAKINEELPIALSLLIRQCHDAGEVIVCR